MNKSSILQPADQASEPVYLAICRRIRQELDSGEFPPGSFLPPERKLAQRTGVSLRTLRQALATLQQEGRITRRQGHGTVVNAAPADPLARHPTVAVAVSPGDMFARHGELIFRQHVLAHLCMELNRCGLGAEVLFMPMLQQAPLPSVLPGQDARLKGLIRERRILGLVGFPRAFDLCPDLPAKSSLPVVMLETSEHVAHADSVGINNTPGMLAAVGELIRQGHRHIAYVAGLTRPVDDLPYALCADSPERFAAYRRALQEAGLPFQETMYREIGFGAGPSEKLVRDWSEKAELPTAIAVFDDTLANDLIGALSRAGFKVPDDVSVVGFGNITPAAQMGQLATVAVDFAEMARLAAQRMKERLSHTGTMTEMFLRASCQFKTGASIAPPRRENGGPAADPTGRKRRRRPELASVPGAAGWGREERGRLP